MNKIKGIIVEQNKDHVVILTPDGRFVKGESEGQEIGLESQVLPVSPESRLLLSSVRNSVAAAALLAAVLLILLSALFLPFRQPALAFIQLEVNPAIEFGIDTEGKVRELTPLNDDGLALIRDLGSWNGMDVTELLGRIIGEYSEAGKELSIISVKAGDEKLAAKVDQTVHFIKETAREEGMRLRLAEADRELRNRAITEGVPISHLINSESNSRNPAPSKRNQQNIDEANNKAPEVIEQPPENNRHPETEGKPVQDNRPKGSGKEELQPPGNSGQSPGIRKEEAPPPATESQAKPAGSLPGNGEKKGKHQQSPKSEKAPPPKGPSERGNQGTPPAHAGPDKKTPPPGHTGQDKQSERPAHAVPQSKDQSGENTGGDHLSSPQKGNSSGREQSSKNGQQNKNGGNGKGGNGKGSGN
ncbi:anti-sigma factor domain-containing protein [Bhargavaea massiliensis]|uniref:anti-sigma-I factor RsgI family protein n=1 Tax=Bhargavaea massiliensis TaxID=2697500 RepID=UPI001BCEAD45|nr:hypothetical protein [Bhargavaea massiliensis]